ncbi:unnamed protein product [Didymodactylos carnosus]|uniref:Ras-associating domain-containing protein n=1 Tax=Didymodactylos carnosus TaxID=1234261 RepID=A0A814QF15_9BILA|nr:unnamed protein product [Didymodactylos carnosus]CAF3883426.1 unnamed protein product [Didymodactylos carnosus]
MYYRMMYLSSISEESEGEWESETDRDDNYDMNNNNNRNIDSDERTVRRSTDNCLGDLNVLKREIEEVHHELSTLEKKCQHSIVVNNELIDVKQFSFVDANAVNVNDLDALLSQLSELETRLHLTEKQQQLLKLANDNKPKMLQTTFNSDHSIIDNKQSNKSIVKEFDELDQALLSLTNTINNVEIYNQIQHHESNHSGSSTSSGIDDDFVHTSQQHISIRSNSVKRPSNEMKLYDCPTPTRNDEVTIEEDVELDNLSDSGLSQSTDSIFLPFLSHLQQKHALSTSRTCSQISNTSSISCENMNKNDKIRQAIEKMKEANIKKLFLKTYNDDNSTKSVLIDETMSVYDIIIMLLNKNHFKPTINYCLIEEIPDLNLYRIYEDHQNLINDGILYWPRETMNRIRFQQYKHKYALFIEPDKFFFTTQQKWKKTMKNNKTNENNNNNNTIQDTFLLTDYISSSSSTIQIPDDIESMMYMKEKSRKIWKKYSCVLRQSGIYYIPKGKTKKDLVCLVKLDSNEQLYYGINWIEKYKAPTEYGFALKHPQIQKKSTKYIKYLCVNTQYDYHRWISGIRLVQYGYELYKSYEKMTKTLNYYQKNGKLPIITSQHQFNFLLPTSDSISLSSATSLPIIQHQQDSLSVKTLEDIETKNSLQAFRSLDRLGEINSSNHRFQSTTSSLRRNSNHSTTTRSQTNSPPLIKSNENVKKSKENIFNTDEQSILKNNIAKAKSDESNINIRETTIEHPPTNLNARRSSSTSISSSKRLIPFLNNCIQNDESKSPLLLQRTSCCSPASILEMKNSTPFATSFHSINPLYETKMSTTYNTLNEESLSTSKYRPSSVHETLDHEQKYINGALPIDRKKVNSNNDDCTWSNRIIQHENESKSNGDHFQIGQGDHIYDAYYGTDNSCLVNPFYDLPSSTVFRMPLPLPNYNDERSKFINKSRFNESYSSNVFEKDEKEQEEKKYKEIAQKSEKQSLSYKQNFLPPIKVTDL